MRTVRPVSEAEMVALFLSTEYPSPRTHQHILRVLQREGWPPSIIEQPNLRDAQENAQRRSILGVYRGYGQNMDYFEGLPPGIRKVDLRAVQEVKKLSENPLIGAYRVRAALEQMGIKRLLKLPSVLQGLEGSKDLCSHQDPKVKIPGIPTPVDNRQDN